MPKTLIIIPSYNEKENIASLIDALLKLPIGADVLIVDDSSDGTAAMLKEKQATEPRLFLIAREKKSGRGTAVLEGFRFALSRDYQRIVEMDADFSHDPKELPSLLAVSDTNKLVIGSRYLKTSRIVNWPLSRRIFSRCANFYANLVLGIGIHDYTNGYRVYGREALEKLDIPSIKSRGYIVLSEIAYQLYRKGVRFAEIPTIFVNRARGVSSFSLKEAREAFLSVLRIRFGT
ncbi:polyprenol monophosphomannose synthase [Candidatus Kaiserbacteria bacterium]|nr:polyprenol monophosphomannose synthase [Candidatus Kaiserbacteria bacterium]